MCAPTSCPRRASSCGVHDLQSLNVERGMFTTVSQSLLQSRRRLLLAFGVIGADASSRGSSTSRSNTGGDGRESGCGCFDVALRALPTRLCFIMEVRGVPVVDRRVRVSARLMSDASTCDAARGAHEQTSMEDAAYCSVCRLLPGAYNSRAAKTRHAYGRVWCAHDGLCCVWGRKVLAL